MINIFFQEWAPLFPILHRPTFLALYEQYVSKPEDLTDKKSIAQLNLCFGIAALSSDVSLSSITGAIISLTFKRHAMVTTLHHSRANGRAPWTPS